jgi:hypothetical protein
MKIIGIAAGALALSGFATPAFADAAVGQGVVVEGEVVTTVLRAPRRAFELGADMGYTQGFGAADGTRAVPDLAGGGLGLGLSLGYRATPRFSIAATGQLQGFNSSNTQPKGTMVRGGTAGVEATFHTAPYDRADPWMSFGVGYRVLSEIPGDTTKKSLLTHGFELGKLSLGVDVRASDSVAISPMIGADLDMFVWQNAPGASPVPIANGGVSAYVFAGVRGRFDLGGVREPKVEHVVVR